MDRNTIGILGLGSRSTLFYLEALNRAYNIKNGGFSTCPFVLLNANFDAINSLLPNPSTSLDAIAQRYITKLEEMDIEFILVPNITLHETIERITLRKKTIHPVSLTISKIKENNWSKVVIFGSLYTMQSPYLSAQFNSQNIETETPSHEDMLLIDEVRKHVYASTETKELIEKYHLLIEKYSKKYPVVLACTELSIFKPNTKNLIDMAEVQIVEAIRIID